MIINIRGTNGSGKSWLVHRIIQYMGGIKTVGRIKQSKGKSIPAVSRCRKRVRGKRVYIIGVYSGSFGGGCDVISNQAIIYRLAAKYSKRGHVILEGLLMSGMCGSLIQISKEIKAEVVWAVLDTPFEMCYTATLLRRHTKGNFQFLDVHKHMIRKHMSVISTAKTALGEGQHVEVLSRQGAFDQILSMLRDGKAKRETEDVQADLNWIKATVKSTHESLYDSCKTCHDFFPEGWYESSDKH